MCVTSPYYQETRSFAPTVDLRACHKVPRIDTKQIPTAKKPSATVSHSCRCPLRLRLCPTVTQPAEGVKYSVTAAHSHGKFGSWQEQACNKARETVKQQRERAMGNESSQEMLGLPEVLK